MAFFFGSHLGFLDSLISRKRTRGFVSPQKYILKQLQRFLIQCSLQKAQLYVKNMNLTIYAFKHQLFWSAFFWDIPIFPSPNRHGSALLQSNQSPQWRSSHWSLNPTCRTGSQRRSASLYPYKIRAPPMMFGKVYKPHEYFEVYFEVYYNYIPTINNP